MQTGPVDFETFLTVASGLAIGGLALAGVLYQRHEKQEARLVALDEKVQAVQQQSITRHDTGLADVWQALDDHRKESRRQAEIAESRARIFTEATLRQLGGIEATLARLEARLPPALPPHHPGA